MSVHLHPYLATFWLVIIAAKLILAVFVWTRPCHRRNWFFVAFVMAWAGRSSVLWALSYFNLAWPYSYVFYVGNGLLHGLAFASAYECFRQLFHPWKKLPRSFANAFIGFVVMITAAPAVMAAIFPALVSQVENTAVQNTIDRTFAIWICGLFWLLSFASDWLCIPWHTRAFGIGLGFLFSYSVDLFLTTMRGLTSWHFGPYLWPIGFTVDLICSVLWIYYFLRKEPELIEPNPYELARIQELLAKIGVSQSQ